MSAAPATTATSAAPAKTEGKETKYADYKQNNLRIGDDAPDFETESQDGKIKWHDYINGHWAVLMSHPRDFTPVCSTEISRVSALTAEWSKRNCKVAVVSVDDAAEHRKWIEEINKLNPEHKVNFPLLDDKNKRIACLYGMLDQTHLDKEGLPFTVRSVFIIGPDKKIKLILTYPASTGRNFAEIIRCLDSLRLAVEKKVATPVDWNRGEDVCILPHVTEDEARLLFPSGYRTLSASCKLRIVPDPLAKPAAPATATATAVTAGAST
jgi:alkyl hydroperoxide reductase subunit AhpC